MMFIFDIISLKLGDFATVVEQIKITPPFLAKISDLMLLSFLYLFLYTALSEGFFAFVRRSLSTSTSDFPSLQQELNI